MANRKIRIFHFLLCRSEERIRIGEFSDFRFLMNLHVLGSIEQNLTIFGKCMRLGVKSTNRARSCTSE